MSTPDHTARLALPFLAEAQAQKHVTLNEGLARLDALVQAGVISRSVTAQPAGPLEGDAYILPVGRTGAMWSTMAVGEVALFTGGAWVLLPVPVGGVVHVGSEQVLLVRTSSGWVALIDRAGALQNRPLVGVRAGADAGNPLTVKGPGALIYADIAAEGGTGDVRLTLSRETASDVATALFQTAGSGRAEIGLAGDDRLSVRTSTDGTAWRTGLVIEPTGRVGVNKTSAAAALDLVVEGDFTATVSSAFYSATDGGVSFVGQKSRGTPTSPTGALAGDRLIGFYAQGRRSDGSVSANAATVQILAAEAFTPAGQGTSISFETTDLGSTTRRAVVRFQPNGSLRLMPQSAAPASPSAGELYFDGTLGKFRGYTGSAWTDL